jgi:hypothetical protein
MAGRKAAAGRKAVPNSTKSIPGARKRASETAPDLQEAQRRNFADVRKRDPKDDPNSQQNIRAKREARHKFNQEAVEGRTKLLEQALPENRQKAREERRQEMEKLSKKAGEEAGGSGFKPPSSPDEKGFIAEPAHPKKPGPRGSAPRSPGTPTGPDGEDVIYVTDDIAEDGTPNVSQGFVEGKPEWDGESDRDYNEVAKRAGRRFEPGAAEPADSPYLPERINQHSPEGAELDSIKEGREVRFVPNDAWLDPVSNNPDRRNADQS